MAARSPVAAATTPETCWSQARPMTWAQMASRSLEKPASRCWAYARGCRRSAARELRVSRPAPISSCRTARSRPPSPESTKRGEVLAAHLRLHGLRALAAQQRAGLVQAPADVDVAQRLRHPLRELGAEHTALGRARACAVAQVGVGAVHGLLAQRLGQVPVGPLGLAQRPRPARAAEAVDRVALRRGGGREAGQLGVDRHPTRKRGSGGDGAVVRGVVFHGVAAPREQTSASLQRVLEPTLAPADGTVPNRPQILRGSGSADNTMPKTMATEPATPRVPNGSPKAAAPRATPTSGSRLTNAPATSALVRACPHA